MRTRASVRLAFLGLSVAVALALGCSEPTQGVVVAPNVDRHPPPQTADGQVVGADAKSPERSAAEGVTTDHLAPGWKADKGGLEYEPQRDPAGPDPGSTHLVRQDGGTETVPSGSE